MVMFYKAVRLVTVVDTFEVPKILSFRNLFYKFNL